MRPFGTCDVELRSELATGVGFFVRPPVRRFDG